MERNNDNVKFHNIIKSKCQNSLCKNVKILIYQYVNMPKYQTTIMSKFKYDNVKILRCLNLYWKPLRLFVIRCLSVHHSSVCCSSVCCPSPFLRANNTALGGHRALPKVANERYCNVVLIFGVIWGSKWQQRQQQKNAFLVGN